MRHIVGLVVMIFSVAVPVQAMLELPAEINRKIGGYLDTTSFLRIPQVCEQTRKIWDNLTSKDLEEHGITLRKAFLKENARILERFIEDGNHGEVVANPYLAKAIMLWAARNGHRTLLDRLRYDKQVVDVMNTNNAREIATWVLIYEYKNFCTMLVKNGSDIDPEEIFVNKGLVIAAKHGVASIVQTFIHTRLYAQALKPKAFNKALLAAVSNNDEKIVRILLSNRRVSSLADQESVRRAVELACENNDEAIVGRLFDNEHVVDLASVSWLKKMSNKYFEDWIGFLLDNCRAYKQYGAE